MTEDKQKQEPPDHHLYSWITFPRDTFLFCLKAVKFYESLLDQDVEFLKADPELKHILDEETLRSFEIYHELKRAKRARESMEKKIKDCKPGIFDYELTSVAHGSIRFLKSAAEL